MTGAAAFEALERRVSALELRLSGVAPSDDLLSAQATLLLRHADGSLRLQRNPKYWNDLPVREAAIASHRKSTIAEAVAQLVAQFGKDRAPSTSALQRLWAKIDLALEEAALRRSGGAPAIGTERA